jgi:hypothetical protein
MSRIGSFPTVEEIIEKTNDESKVHFVAMIERIGVNGFLTEVEYTYFRPDTPMQEKFELAVMKWPFDDPAFFMLWMIASIPVEFTETATKLLFKHGLKVCGSKDPGQQYTCIVFGPNGPESFPLRGKTVLHLENHSEATQHVAYTNDPVKIRAAREHEEAVIVKQFHDEHERWLSVPENYAAAEAYWASRPDIYPPEEKPPRRPTK